MQCFRSEGIKQDGHFCWPSKIHTPGHPGVGGLVLGTVPQVLVTPQPCLAVSGGVMLSVFHHGKYADVILKITGLNTSF